MERRNRDGGCGLTGRFSIAVLIAANLLPLAGVLFWDWDWGVFLVLLLFWCENVVIGLFGIARLIVAGESESVTEGLFLPLFFLVHYGAVSAHEDYTCSAHRWRD
ncbi:MAG: DUF6498-containing protein [Gammaproteobacteria bacterium]|nr:DUF6498-containing protein [Gammaproteobacteria bacterium]